MKAVYLFKIANDEETADEARAHIHEMLYGDKKKEKPPSILAKAKGKLDGLKGFKDEESSTSGGHISTARGNR